MTHKAQGTDVVILSGVRTPIGNLGGVFKGTPAVLLGGVAIAGAVRRAGLTPNDIDEVLMGVVLSANQGQAPARQAALNAGLLASTPCTSINKICGSGMKAVMLANDEIKAGSASIIVAGGMECMSEAPYLLSKTRFGHRLGHHQVIDHMLRDGLEDAYSGLSMGHFAENCSDHFNFSRDELDEYAELSLSRAKTALREGYFNAEIEAVILKDRNGEGLIQEDENPLLAKAERIRSLKPVFKTDGKITAANASSISDGAAALVLTSQTYANQKKLTPMASLIAHASVATEPAWFTTAPIDAIKQILKKTGWTINDVDLFEINEAFAAVSLAAIRELNLDIQKVNIHGGACALGHPIGASGARIIVSLMHALKRVNKRRGIATLCIGGGEATAVAIELN
jgi:acetyl-CoA C-acetyltransferase